MRFSNEYGFCEINSIPGCTQLAIFNHAFIYKEHRGKGHGLDNHKLRLKRAKQMGYDCAMCTVRAGNEAQIAILRSNGWTRVFEFHNIETEHDVQVWMRKL
jgi:RimJ/RimL family protein N-acetyltransferase